MVVSKKKFVSEIVQKLFGDKCNYSVLSGPSFAEEIVREYPTAVVVASRKRHVIFYDNLILFLPYYHIKVGWMDSKGTFQQLLQNLYGRWYSWCRDQRSFEECFCNRSGNHWRIWLCVQYESPSYYSGDKRVSKILTELWGQNSDLLRSGRNWGFNAHSLWGILKKSVLWRKVGQRLMNGCLAFYVYC